MTTAAQPTLLDPAPQTRVRTSLPRTKKAPHPLLHLASKGPRGVRASWCRVCGVPILSGLDADVCAFYVKVDATPLDATGEMLALLSDPPRTTYQIDRLGHSPRLTRRRAFDITTNPAGPRADLKTWDVLPAHRCGAPLPAIPSNFPEALEAITNECPF